MSLWGSNDQADNAPKSAVDDKSNTGTDQFGNTVFGVDAAEVAAGTAAHSGWVRRTEGTGGRAGRVQEEVLVAMSGSTAFASGDANTVSGVAEPTGGSDDTEYPDA